MTVSRILTGGIMQESHSFNPIVARRSDFAISKGDNAVRLARGINTILGGIVDAATAKGIEAVVPIMAQAPSGGPVDDAVFEEVRDVLVEAARGGGFDAIVLALHGGMLTTSLSDPEAALFQPYARRSGQRCRSLRLSTSMRMLLRGPSNTSTS